MSEPPEQTAPRRLGPFRVWEVVVIAIAIVLFVIAAFAGPSQPPPPVAAPSGSPGPVPSASTAASGTPSPGAATSPTPAPTQTALIPRDEQGRTGSPVVTVEQVLVDEVGDYVLANRGLSEADVRGGALESTELRYATQPQDDATDVFHGVEVHLDAAAARARVRTFGEELEESGFEVFRRQALRGPTGNVQGAYLELRNGDQQLLLWSNRNVMFSLGGGEDADLHAFYEGLPY